MTTELLIHFYRAGLGSTADSKFHRQGGQTEENQAEHIHKHKAASAVLPCHPRELPDITAADGTAGTEKNKPKTAAELFSIIIHFPHSYFRQYPAKRKSSSGYMKFTHNYTHMSGKINCKPPSLMIE